MLLWTPRTTSVVPGKPSSPTVDRHFNVYVQYESQTMQGLNGDGSCYVEPGDSHGCVNTPTSDTDWIDHWANLDTSVMSHYEKRLSQDIFT